ncbi:alpha/beta hydrolase family protein [Cryobacterium cheniae]
MLRGHDYRAPVLLFLEGGPGGTAVGSMRIAGQGLEKNFVVATWDQRGAGKSAAAFEPVATLTVDQAVHDAIEVSEYLRDRFNQPRIYLVGSSWGTVLGVLAAQQRPDLFAAYVGTGQMVDLQATDKLMYAESVAYAQRVGDGAFGDQLAAIGPRLTPTCSPTPWRSLQIRTGRPTPVDPTTTRRRRTQPACLSRSTRSSNRLVGWAPSSTHLPRCILSFKQSTFGETYPNLRCPCF